MADLCEKVGRAASGPRHRLGQPHWLRVPTCRTAYGGSCFPRDTLALARTAEQAGSPVCLIKTTVQVNGARKKAMAEKVKVVMGGAVKGKTIGTQHRRHARRPLAGHHLGLQAMGATIQAFDPEDYEARKLLPNIPSRLAPTTPPKAPTPFILTEWDRFRARDLDRIKLLLKAPLVIDLRNIYAAQDMTAEDSSTPAPEGRNRIKRACRDMSNFRIRSEWSVKLRWPNNSASLQYSKSPLRSRVG